MHHRTVFAVAVVAFAGLFLAMQAGATGQDKAASPKWEFKTVPFGSDEKESTKKLNDLAAADWAYVGSLGNGLVAFKRPARSTQAVPEITKEHLASKVPNFFYFDYEFDPGRGKRLWLRIDDNHFIERGHANGHEAKYKLVSRTEIDGTQGTVVALVGDDKEPDFQVFIPDRGSKKTTVLFRRLQVDRGQWKFVSAEMKKVE